MKNDSDIEFGDYVTRARIKNSHSNALASFISEVGTVALTVIAILDMFSAPSLLLWFAFCTLTALLSYLINLALNPESKRIWSNKWRMAELTTTFSVAFSWGTLLILFFSPGNMVYLAFVIAIYAGYVAGALSVNFNDRISFLVFSTGITAPVTARLFYEGTNPYPLMGCLVVFFYVMLNFVAENLYQQFIESTRNQFDNDRLVKELAIERETVQRTVQAKDRFFASASHDLRQPLNAIGLFVDALRPRLADPVEVEIIERLGQSLSGLNQLLHSVLDISTLDAGAVENRPKHLSLNSIIGPLVSDYRSKSKNIRIENNTADDCIVFADPSLLYRIVLNLLDNAVKYTDRGYVRLTSSASASKVCLKIEDTGIGIPSEKLQSVFEEFEQLNNPERDRSKGLGLGLSIVKRLCKVTGIKLSLQSTSHQGTIAQLDIERGEIEFIQHDVPKSKIDLGGITILVVDDELEILEGMKYILSSWGASVVIAQSLTDALKQLHNEDHSPDVIISDFRLTTSQNGIDLIECIRLEFNRNIPSILITGDTAPERINLANEATCEVMYKPVDSEDLKRLIRKIVSKGD